MLNVKRRSLGSSLTFGVYAATILLGLLHTSSFAGPVEQAASLAANNTASPGGVTVDLNIGESVAAKVDGKEVTVELIAAEVQRGSLRGAIRSAKIKVKIAGKPVELPVGNYSLPVTVGSFRIDCPVIGAFRHDNKGKLDLQKDARIRLWPLEGAFAPGGPWTYPVKQRWFAATTQMSAEPGFNLGVQRLEGKTYHHFPQDIGGYKDEIPVLACLEGVVVSVNGRAMEGYKGPGRKQKRGERLFIESTEPATKGWLIKHSHLSEVPIEVGQKVKRG